VAAPAAHAAADGYRLLGMDGGVFDFGAPFLGAPASDPTRCPPNPANRSLPDGSCSAIAATPDGGGYWILNRAGGRVFAYGDARSDGGDFAAAGTEFAPAGTGIVATGDGHGYRILELGLSGMTAVAAYGDAVSHGDEISLFRSDPSRFGAGFNASAEGLAATHGGGYWLAASDGGVFSFGDVAFHGSMGATHLNAPVVGVAG